MEHKYQMIPVSKDTTAYKMSIGYSISLEKKIINMIIDLQTHIFMVNMIVILVTVHLSII